MTYTEGSHEVLLSYLLDINFYYQEFLRYLAKKSSSDLTSHLFKAFADANLVQNSYIQQFNCIKEHSYIIYSPNKNFRIKLIHKKIFSGLYKKPLKSISDLYKILICIEHRTVLFLKNNFNTFPYINFRHLLNEIINEKNKHIEQLKILKNTEALP